MYVDSVEIWKTQPKLQHVKTPIDYTVVLHEAEKIVRGDVDAYLNLDLIDDEIRQTQKPPSVLWALALSKAREIAYRIYYDGREPEFSEVVLYREEYSKRLQELKADIKQGNIDIALRDAVDKTQNVSLFV